MEQTCRAAMGRTRFAPKTARSPKAWACTTLTLEVPMSATPIPVNVYPGEIDGVDALTGKPTQGLMVGFGNEPPCLLSRRSFWQLLSMRAAQLAPKAGKPTIPMATP